MTKITIERETIQRAIDALELESTTPGLEATNAAIAALRAALAAQPADQELTQFEANLIESVEQMMRGEVARVWPAQPADQVAWPGKAMELATDFGVESLRLGSSERVDIFLSNGVASWKTVALREKREAARERLRQHIYAAPAAVPPGYALVPVEPSPSQRYAGAVALTKASDSDLDCTTDEIAAAYRAMIAAAGDKP